MTFRLCYNVIIIYRYLHCCANPNRSWKKWEKLTCQKIVVSHLAAVADFRHLAFLCPPFFFSSRQHSIQLNTHTHTYKQINETKFDIWIIAIPIIHQYIRYIQFNHCIIYFIVAYLSMTWGQIYIDIGVYFAIIIRSSELRL